MFSLFFIKDQNNYFNFSNYMEGVLFEIFSNLPAKSVFKFSLLSKQINEFASDKFFGKIQSKNLELKDDNSFFLQPKYPAKPLRLQLYTLSDADKSWCGIPQKSLNFLGKIGNRVVLASSNGLICCRNLEDNEYPLLVCNPATQTWVPIVKPTDGFDPQIELYFVFECNARCTDDYILMVVLPSKVYKNCEGCLDSTKLTVKIYSPTKEKWEDIEGHINEGQRYLKYERPVYIEKDDGGILYFVSDCREYLGRSTPCPYVVAYSFKNCASTFFELPKDVMKGVVWHSICTLNIFKFKYQKRRFASICLVKFMRSVLSVWVLEEDLNKWNRIINVSLKDLGLKRLEEPMILGLTVLNGNMLLFATDQEEVYRYDLSVEQRFTNAKAEKIGRHDCGGGSVIFHSYSNTLRSCGDAAVWLPDAFSSS